MAILVSDFPVKRRLILEHSITLTVHSVDESQPLPDPISTLQPNVFLQRDNQNVSLSIFQCQKQASIRCNNVNHSINFLNEQHYGI